MSKKNRLLVFGGTTEGRKLAQVAVNLGFSTTVSVATPLGAEELRDIAGVRVEIGRLDAEGMEKLLKNYGCCVDATHPYASEASENIKIACQRTNVCLCRLLREENDEKWPGVWVEGTEQAAELLKNTQGNILLTTGAKELPAFAALLPAERLFPRVLPVPESLLACRTAGIPTRNIIAMHGPFTQALNEAILAQYHIRFLVTKDGGRAGGFTEKAQAAQSVGADLIVISRPAETGVNMENTVKWLCSLRRRRTRCE